jgi:hypothetical protein
MMDIGFNLADGGIIYGIMIDMIDMIDINTIGDATMIDMMD